MGTGCGESGACSPLPEEVVKVRDHLYLLALLNMLVHASPWDQEKRTTDMLYAAERQVLWNFEDRLPCPLNDGSLPASGPQLFRHHCSG